MGVDTLLGVSSMLFIYFNVSNLLRFVHQYGSAIHIEVLFKEVEWLMGVPAGLKTNRPLNYVLGQFILYVIQAWNHLTTFLTPYEQYLLEVMLLFCLFGLTFEIALASDFINLLTIHVYYLYRGIMRFYREVINFIVTLYRFSQDR